MDENQQWHRSQILENVSQKLTENGFPPLIAATVEQARAQAMSLIAPSETVGIGGSMSVEQMGLIPALRQRGTTVLQHVAGMSLEESLALRRSAMTADVYVASPNAVTMDGELVLCDGVGNRAAAMIFGPKKVIAVAGYNKIVLNEHAAWQRINAIAAPTNAKRLQVKTPCATTGVCGECASPERICNIGVTLWKRPRRTEYTVILVQEEMGY